MECGTVKARYPVLLMTRLSVLYQVIPLMHVRYIRGIHRGFDRCADSLT